VAFLIMQALLKSDSNLARNSQPHIQMAASSGIGCVHNFAEFLQVTQANCGTVR